ncbi:hypothetical protein T484DRAFT_1847981 [Baffinella frigidus]|nr:hypothetical protein T484DRAFT_1847981 [Cryptophyta sp. CCMP2293]
MSTLACSQFPEKQVFGKMSPSLVRERQTKIENYLKEISRDKDLRAAGQDEKYLKEISRDTDLVSLG